jgi:ATP-binding cassette subfamily B protein
MKQATSSKERYRLFRSGWAARGGRPEPSADAATGTPRLPPRSRLGAYAGLLRPHGGILALVVALAVVGILTDLAWPLLSRHMIDEIVLAPGLAREERMRQLALAGGCLAALFALNGLAGLARSLRLATLEARLTLALRRRLYQRILHLPLAALAELKTGGIISRLSTDVDGAIGLVQHALIGPLFALLRLALTFAIMFALCWPIALAALVMMPPVLLLYHRWVRRVRPIWKEIGQDRAAIDGRVAEAVGGIRVVRGFAREQQELLEYATGHHTVTRKQLLAARLQQVMGLAWGLGLSLAQLAVLWFGGWLVILGHTTIGTLMALQGYVWRLVEPLTQLAGALGATQRGLAAMERVFEVLARPGERPDAADARDAPAAIGELRFERVGFAYPGGSPVIHDFELTVPAGAVVALVGASGAGKTTIADLVAGFHAPTSGRITVAGVDLARFRARSWRRLLGIVQQEVFLFDGTVRENIAYSRRDASEAQIVDAARRANAEEFIRELPAGYDTEIGERGVKLSGGQRQRLSIARALLADPALLILDEATSNLDTRSEQLIQASLRELFHGRTTFIIAHRLSTIASASLVVVLDHGRIVEAGSQRELLERQGRYWELVQRQRADGPPVLAEALAGGAWP